MNLYSQLLDLGIEPAFIDAVAFAGGGGVGGAPAAPSAPSAPAGPSVSSSGVAKLPSTPGAPRMPKITASKTTSMQKIAKGPGVTLPTGVHIPQPAAPHVAIHVHAPGQTSTSPSVTNILPPSPVQVKQASANPSTNKADQNAQAQYDKAMAKYNAKIKAADAKYASGYNPFVRLTMAPPPDPRKAPKNFQDMTKAVANPSVSGIRNSWMATVNAGGNPGNAAYQYQLAVASALGLTQMNRAHATDFEMPKGLTGDQMAQLVNSQLLYQPGVRIGSNPIAEPVGNNPMPGAGMNIHGYVPPKGLKTYVSSISDYTVSKDKWFNTQTGQVEPIPANLKSGAWKGSEGGSALPPGYKQDASGNQIA